MRDEKGFSFRVLVLVSKWEHAWRVSLLFPSISLSLFTLVFVFLLISSSVFLVWDSIRVCGAAAAVCGGISCKGGEEEIDLILHSIVPLLISSIFPVSFSLCIQRLSRCPSFSVKLYSLTLQTFDRNSGIFISEFLKRKSVWEERITKILSYRFPCSLCMCVFHTCNRLSLFHVNLTALLSIYFSHDVTVTKLSPWCIGRGSRLCHGSGNAMNKAVRVKFEEWTNGRMVKGISSFLLSTLGKS